MKKNTEARDFFYKLDRGKLYALPKYNLKIRAMYYRVAREMGLDICILKGQSGLYYLIRIE